MAMDSKEKSVEKMNKKESVSDQIKSALKADRAEQASKAQAEAKKAADKKKFSLKYSGVSKSPLDE